LVYFGSPALAVAPLDALIAAGHEIALVVSQPDAKRGRGSATTPSPVKQRALDLGLNVTSDPNDALTVPAELGVVVAYGRLLSAQLVHSLPMVNLHFSLLPRWRGAAPVERAILAGDATTGVCLMAVEEGLDTGGVYAQAEVAVGEKSLEELRSELVARGCELLTAKLHRGLDSLGDATPQRGEPTYAKKLRSEEYVLDLTRPAVELSRVIRLGRAFTVDGDRRLRILAARVRDANLESGQLDGVVLGTGEGALELELVQPEGKAAMPATAWALGRRRSGGLGASRANVTP
jgi:methionyl-tRNA formyltransferase